MEAMEHGQELHTLPTRLHPPLRDTLLSGEAYVTFPVIISCAFTSTDITHCLYRKAKQKCVYENESYCVERLCKFSCSLLSLPMAVTDREQLKIELQQVNQQINQQTQMHSMEVCMFIIIIRWLWSFLKDSPQSPFRNDLTFPSSDLIIDVLKFKGSK